MASPQRDAARGGGLESVIGVFNGFQRRAGEATGGGDGAGALRVMTSAMFCCELGRATGVRGYTGEREEV
jgi:hypothetical protein